MKLCGNNLILCLWVSIVYLLVACKSNSTLLYTAKDGTPHTPYNYYFNDSLKISMVLDNYYNFLKPTNSDASFLSSQLAIRPILPEKKILTTCSTLAAPYSKVFFMVISKSMFSNQSWKKYPLEGTSYSFFNNFQYKKPLIVIDLGYKLNENNLYVAITAPNIDTIHNICQSMLPNIQLGDKYLNIAKSGDIFKALNMAFKRVADKGNYLAPALLTQRLEKSVLNEIERNTFLQAQETYYSFLSIDNQYLSKSKKNEERKNILNTCKVKQEAHAITYLIEKCKDNQVVMFNEHHRMPRHRYLLHSLLDTLYKVGFKVLALEALDKEPLESDTNFPNMESGFYTREPQMANLIRTAKRIGYKLITYEDTINSIDRELTQSNNLIEKTIKQHPNEKILVLAGHGHIKEDTIGTGRKYFACYFKEATNINPLTINQVSLDNVDFTDNKLLVFDGEELRKKLGKLYGNDLYLVNHLPSATFKVAPDKLNKTIIIPIKLDVSKIITNKLVALVYLASEIEAKNSLPIATCILDRDVQSVVFNLSEQSFYLIVRNSMGDIVFKTKI